MDKPYIERTGGSYVRDKETGVVRRADEVRPAEQPAASGEPAGEPSGDSKKRGK